MSFDLSNEDEDIINKMVKNTKAAFFGNSEFDIPAPTRRYTPKQLEGISTSTEQKEEDSDSSTGWDSDYSWPWTHKTIHGAKSFIHLQLVFLNSNLFRFMGKPWDDEAIVV